MADAAPTTSTFFGLDVSGIKLVLCEVCTIAAIRDGLVDPAATGGVELGLPAVEPCDHCGIRPTTPNPIIEE